MQREEIVYIRQNKTFQKLEKEVREQRQSEAVKKGIAKKAAEIARYLGSEIRAPGFGGLEDVGFTQRDYDLDAYSEDNSEILETSDDSFGLIGWSFDALNYGCNIQINLMIEEYRITVFNNGNVVFDEVAGDLEKYIPDPEWESRIEHWHKNTEKMKKRTQIAEQQVVESQSSRLLQNIKDLLRITWGV